VFRGREQGIEEVEVLVEDGVIAEVGPALARSAARTIDATGMLLGPGLVDAHVHMRDPGATHKECFASGSMACAAGGVTTFFDMPNTHPPTTTAQRVRDKLSLAAAGSHVDFGVFIGATPHNLDELRKSTGHCGIKLFLGASTGDLLVDKQEALELLFGQTDPSWVIAVHCEDEDRMRALQKAHQHRTDASVHSVVRDDRVGLLATERALDLAARHKHRTHIAHVSSALEATALSLRSKVVTAEVAPHHLLLDVSDYERLGGLAKMNPSLKTAADRHALWQALHSGAIDAIATDHAPHTLEEKTRPNIWDVPSGVPCVENSLGLLLDAAHRGSCSVAEVFTYMSEAPARLFGLASKGRIATGADADLVLVDPRCEHLIDNASQWTRCGWSPWHGAVLRGWPVLTMVRGAVVFEQGKIVGEPRGRNACETSERG
jgi:dihydroorotase